VRKRQFNVRCKGCNVRNTTTREEVKDNFYCKKCREKRDNFHMETPALRKPSLFKRATGWLIDKFGE